MSRRSGRPSLRWGTRALVVGDSRAVKVHVHSPEPGTPINYGASVGSISRVIVENMQEQYQDFILSKAQRPAAPVEPLSGVGTVVVAPGQGLSTGALRAWEPVSWFPADRR